MCDAYQNLMLSSLKRSTRTSDERIQWLFQAAHGGGLADCVVSGVLVNSAIQTFVSNPDSFASFLRVRVRFHNPAGHACAYRCVCMCVSGWGGGGGAELMVAHSRLKTQQQEALIRFEEERASLQASLERATNSLQRLQDERGRLGARGPAEVDVYSRESCSAAVR